MRQRNTLATFAEIMLLKPRTSVVLIGCIFASATVEALGITATIPLLSAILGGTETLWRPDFIKDLGLSAKGEVYLFAVLVGLAFTVKALILLASSYVMARSMSQYSAEIRERYLNNLAKAKIQYLNNSEIGKHIAILGTDSIRSTTAYITCFRFTAALVQSLMFAIYAMILSFELTILATIAGIILALSLRQLIKLSRHAGETMTESTHAISSIVGQAIRGMTDFRSMATERFLIDRVLQQSKTLRDAHFYSIFSGQAMRALQEPIVIICGVLSLMFLTYAVKINPAIIILISGIFYRLLQSFSALQSEYQRFAAQDSAVYAIMGGIDAADKNREPYQEQTQRLSDDAKLNLVFDNVSFSYGTKNILENFNATIPEKSVTLFFGPSGKGKSTAAHLLTGLIQPDKGAISINGTNITELSQKGWREKIGYVGQSPFFFIGTIAENISIGRDIDETSLEKALALSNSKTFVDALPEGTQTVVEEGGSNFSGGQIQRLAIARAIAAEPAVLILDEPTSALDNESKLMILETIRELSRNVSIVIISHDADALEYADNIVKF